MDTYEKKKIELIYSYAKEIVSIVDNLYGYEKKKEEDYEIFKTKLKLITKDKFKKE